MIDIIDIVLSSKRTKVSKQEGNVLQKNEDGLFVPTVSVEISKLQDNSIENQTDGLYVKKIENEDSNIDFSDYFNS